MALFFFPSSLACALQPAASIVEDLLSPYAQHEIPIPDSSHTPVLLNGCEVDSVTHMQTLAISSFSSHCLTSVTRVTF